MSGKGSKPRPYSVDKKTFDDNWDKIFSKTTASYHMHGTKQEEKKTEEKKK